MQLFLVKRGMMVLSGQEGHWQWKWVVVGNVVLANSRGQEVVWPVMRLDGRPTCFMAGCQMLLRSVDQHVGWGENDIRVIWSVNSLFYVYGPEHINYVFDDIILYMLTLHNNTFCSCHAEWYFEPEPPFCLCSETLHMGPHVR